MFMILVIGKFDHHQKNRNGKKKNGIYYSSIGLLWKKFGKDYLEKLNVKDIDKTFKYMDTELGQDKHWHIFDITAIKQ